MSAVLLPELRGNNQSLQGTTTGDTKPLHRFLKGQPKAVGSVVLILGASCFIFTIVNPVEPFIMTKWTVINPRFLQASLLIMCGIMYVLTEHKPTKKKVTISLSLSIVSIMLACWTPLQMLTEMERYYHEDIDYFHLGNYTESEHAWPEYYKRMELALESVCVAYALVGGVILIVMSALAVGALRSVKTQGIVVMTTAATETPTEEQAQDVCL